MIGSDNLDGSLCLLDACQILSPAVYLKPNTEQTRFLRRIYFERCLILTYRQL